MKKVLLSFFMGGGSFLHRITLSWVRLLIAGGHLSLLGVPFLNAPAIASAAPRHSSVPASPAAYADGPVSSTIQCGAFRHNPGDFTVSDSGGYVGLNKDSNFCNGSFSYVLTPTSSFATWPANIVVDNPVTEHVDIWVYIPTINAGAIVNYAASVCTDGLNHCGAFQDFNTNYNQNIVCGWQKIGTVDIPPFGGLSQVKMYSTSQLQFFMAEDAFGVVAHSS